MMMLLKVKTVVMHEVIDRDHSKDKGTNDNTKGHNQDKDTTKSIITPLTCTYHKGTRQVFFASKRKGALPFASTPKLDKGKENMEKGKHQVKVRISKRQESYSRTSIH